MNPGEWKLDLSVIIPLFNKKNEIRDTIESVLRQTISNFELIVVDDGSTDGSCDIITEILDARIRLIRQPNQGVSVARNTGIQNAKGELLLFLDADDLWEPYFIEEIVSLHNQFPQAGLYATAYRYHSNGIYTNLRFKYIDKQSECQILGNYFKAAMGPPPVWSSAVAIPKSSFLSVGMFSEGLKNGEDLDMWARVALNFPVAWSPRPCSIYNRSSETGSAGNITTEDVTFINYLNNTTEKNKFFIEYILKKRAELAKKMILRKKYFESLLLMRKCLSIKIFSLWYVKYLKYLLKGYFRRKSA